MIRKGQSLNDAIKNNKDLVEKLSKGIDLAKLDVDALEKLLGAINPQDTTVAAATTQLAKVSASGSTVAELSTAYSNIVVAVSSLGGPRDDVATALGQVLAEAAEPAAPVTGNYYMEVGGQVFRGDLQAGPASLIVAPDVSFRLFVYDPIRQQIGEVVGSTGGNGEVTRLPGFTLHDATKDLTDTDADGLSDAVEVILGTNPNNPDTDGDGISDAAEIQQGTDPLSNLAVRTGIISTVPTPAPATDVAAFNNIAAVATGSSGVTILNIANVLNPTRLAQLATRGTARAVACSVGFVAVAVDTAGIAIIDIRNPNDIQITHQFELGGRAQAVAVAGDLAYVGLDSGQVVCVDMVSGSILGLLSTGASVQDLALAGDSLFVLLPSELRTYRTDGSDLLPSGSTLVSTDPPEGLTGRKRLFVGDGVAYATSYDGYETIDVRDPAKPARISAARSSGPNSFKQIVLNGSGLGLAAVGINPRLDGTHDVSLFDTSDTKETAKFLTIITTPGTSYAVSIYNGLAFVADGQSGLQVINYLSYDNKKVPPSILLSANFPLSPPQAEEGKLVRVTASVSDDVQVRNVEFWLCSRICG